MHSFFKGPKAKSMIFEDYNVVDYAMSVGAPEMNATTVCFWVNSKQEKGYAFYISYAILSSTNQLIIHDHTNLGLVINHNTGGDKVYSSRYDPVFLLPSPLNTNLLPNMNNPQ